MNSNKTVGITGGSGALGTSLISIFRSKGYKTIGFTHSKCPKNIKENEPNEWIYWECGKEFLLEESLKNIDILILNHGIYSANTGNNDYENSIEINALSKLRILNIFEKISLLKNDPKNAREIWINTSEAEILPALSPSYEISKLLIGQLVSFKKNLLTRNDSKKLILKKIIIGPFKSELNPIGVMSPEVVAFLIYYMAKLNTFLIIISPNPLTYIIFPMKEIYFSLYCAILKLLKQIKFFN